MDVAPNFVKNWMSSLMHNPDQASDDFGIIIVGLERPRSTSCLRRLTTALEAKPDLYLLLEHCLIYLENASKKNGSVLNHRTMTYLDSLLVFLERWIVVSGDATKDLFNSGILTRTLIPMMSVHDSTRASSVLMRRFCSLLRIYLSGEVIESHGFIQTEEGLDQVERIADIFCVICCKTSQEPKLLALFLEVVEHCNFLEHQDYFLDGVFGHYIKMMPNYIEFQAKRSEFEATKDYFKRQLKNAIPYYGPLVDGRQNASILGLIARKLVVEHERERFEIPAMREVIIRDLLDKFEPRKGLHNRFADELLGRNRTLTQYERENGRQQQIDDPWPYTKLTEEHIVYKYLAATGAMRAYVRPGMYTARGSRRAISKYMASIRENGRAFYDPTTDNAHDNDHTLEQSLGRYFQRETERIVLELLPEMLGDDIPFLTPGDDSSCSSSFSSMDDTSDLDAE